VWKIQKKKSAAGRQLACALAPLLTRTCQIASPKFICHISGRLCPSGVATKSSVMDSAPTRNLVLVSGCRLASPSDIRCAKSPCLRKQTDHDSQRMQHERSSQLTNSLHCPQLTALYPWTLVPRQLHCHSHTSPDPQAGLVFRMHPTPKNYYQHIHNRLSDLIGILIYTCLHVNTTTDVYLFIWDVLSMECSWSSWVIVLLCARTRWLPDAVMPSPNF
jgi:hypothetical protein